MPAPSNPELEAFTRPLMTRAAVGSLKLPPVATWLVRVRHPEHGDELNGRALCDEIRQALKHQPGTFCFFYDGMGMVNARIGYANVFKELDRELSDRVTEVVCAIPGPIPRMMAYTVATLSRSSWTIFRTLAEAETHLRMRGYIGPDLTQPLEGGVNVRVLRRA
ncbi:hypothetical protein [Archangium lipolyticum]|uniref:hypothetical protein n=1 Tax=Archangium lipolyticum TaxID=2970465 RepID=UPI002149D650|nr:hypothetical protein [Archangium lipolyticum]